MSIVPNYYQYLGENKEKKPYPNFDKIKIPPVQRWLIFGSSGSGKNNTLVYIIQNMDCWQEIFICARHTSQPLLQLLEKAGCFLTDDIMNMPNLESIPDDKKIRLFVFDDFQGDKKTLEMMSDYYTRCRHKKIAIMGLFQNYYSIPKVCRGNADILVITKILSTKDLKRMLSEYSLNDISVEDLSKIYKYIKAESPQNFMTIDLNTNDDGWKYRKNLFPLKLK